ncbi:MAG: metal-dependent transcriptional regulator [Ignavibacteriae bacterium]|nr:metal-dependent transcriptional regulator [Ignavibacteriota bacterium]
MQNQSTEDYIKSIYKLKKEGKSVSTSSLAKHLNIGDGSVTGMVKKLSDRKLIHYRPYQGVELTEEGRRLALKMTRRHRLWEMFLVQFLGYQWDKVHDEAERLEHMTSDELEDRIDKALGYPKVDPHGDPIPTVTGELVELTYKNLAECEAGKSYVIIRVSDESPEVLQYLTQFGLSLNKKIKLMQKIQFDGSVVIKVRSQQMPLSQRLAQSIFVEMV